MMHDNLDPRDGLTPAHSTQQDSQTAEHEVAPSARISDAVHAWLDGEPVNDAQLAAASREVAFWTKVQAETSVRRRMTTPAHVPAQILAKLGEQK